MSKTTMLRRLRLERDLTISQVSVAIGYDQGNLSRVERGVHRPAVDVALRLAIFYGVSLDTIYEHNNEKVKQNGGERR